MYHHTQGDEQLLSCLTCGVFGWDSWMPTFGVHHMCMHLVRSQVLPWRVVATLLSMPCVLRALRTALHRLACDHPHKRRKGSGIAVSGGSCLMSCCGAQPLVCLLLHFLSVAKRGCRVYNCPTHLLLAALRRREAIVRPGTTG